MNQPNLKRLAIMISELMKRDNNPTSVSPTSPTNINQTIRNEPLITHLVGNIFEQSQPEKHTRVGNSDR